MEKSMYSVILRDDLVEELDGVAFRNGVRDLLCSIKFSQSISTSKRRKLR